MVYRRAASGGQSKRSVARWPRCVIPERKTGYRHPLVLDRHQEAVQGEWAAGKTDLYGVRVFRRLAG